VLVKAEQRKGAQLLTAHVAILTTQGYLGPTGEARAVAAATAFVQQHSTALRRQLVQQELADAEKGLARLRSELSALQGSKRNEVTASPSEEGTKELNVLLKERTRIQERSRKAMELEHDMKKKVDDLSFAIRKNTEDQNRKLEEVARQEVLVTTLKEKLSAIH
jgi:hypothetical protein